MKNQLFGVFCKEYDTQSKIDYLIEVVKPERIFQYTTEHDEVLLTYTSTSTDSLPGTLVLHRKKEFNVLFSINSLNVITSQTGLYEVDFSKYKESLLTTVAKDLRVSKIKLQKVHRF